MVELSIHSSSFSFCGDALLDYEDFKSNQKGGSRLKQEDSVDRIIVKPMLLD